MADKPVGEVVAVDAVLDALSSPTSSGVPAGGASISVEVYPGQGAFVSGSANVYALILDPA